MGSEQIIWDHSRLDTLCMFLFYEFALLFLLLCIFNFICSDLRNPETLNFTLVTPRIQGESTKVRRNSSDVVFLVLLIFYLLLFYFTLVFTRLLSY